MNWQAGAPGRKDDISRPDSIIATASPIALTGKAIVIDDDDDASVGIGDSAHGTTRTIIRPITAIEYRTSNAKPVVCKYRSIVSSGSDGQLGRRDLQRHENRPLVELIPLSSFDH